MTNEELLVRIDEVKVLEVTQESLLNITSDALNRAEEAEGFIENWKIEQNTRFKVNTVNYVKSELVASARELEEARERANKGEKPKTNKFK